MFRRKFSQFLDDNRFSVLMLCISVLISSALYIMISISPEDPGYSVSCFNDQLILECKERKNIDNVCSKKLEKFLVGTCGKLKSLGLYPLEKTKVNVFQKDECNGWLKEKSGCMPFFYHEESVQPNTSGSKKPIVKNNYLFFPTKSLSGKDTSGIIAHELTHVLMVKSGFDTARIVGEFFAVYVETFVLGKNVERQYICQDELSNQPVLSTIDGAYMFPVLSGNTPMFLLSSCRYGQLAYISRQLANRFPGLFHRLWQKAEAHSGFVNLALFKKWIKEIDKGAYNFIASYYIFQDTDFISHAAIVRWKEGLIVFVYHVITPSREAYLEDGGITMVIRKEDKSIMYSFDLDRSGCIALPNGRFKSGTKIFLKIFFINGLILDQELTIP